MKTEKRLSAAQEEALRSQSPHSATFPPSLHDSIISAVRSSAHEPQRPATPVLGIGIALLAVFAVVTGLWWTHRSPKPAVAQVTLSEPAKSLLKDPPGEGTRPTSPAPDSGVEWSRIEGLASTGPLSDELAALNRDLKGSASFVLANLP